MNNQKKTARPRAYPADFRASVVAHAVRFSMLSASRKFKVNHQSVKNWLVAAGHTPRRQGSLTLEETVGYR